MRAPEPGESRSAPQRVPLEERGVLRDPPPVAAAVGDDEARDDCVDSPSEALAYATSETELDVKAAEQALKIGDDSLDLDHEKKTGPWVVRDEIVPTTVTVVAETHLCARDPAGALEPPFPMLLESRVVRVQQLREVRAVPTRLEL